MKGKFVVNYLGVEKFRGKADPSKVYASGVFLQDTETIKVFLQDGQDNLFDGLEPFDLIEVELDISIGREKTYTTLLSVISLQDESKLKLAK